VTRRARYEVIVSRRTSRFTAYTIYDHKKGRVLADQSTRDRPTAERTARELNAALDEEPRG
jgi:hypothetical protein